MKRFYRSTTDKKIAGICGGIAEYFDIDPTIVRILWVCGLVAMGTGIIAYILFWICAPKKPKT